MTDKQAKLVAREILALLGETGRIQCALNEDAYQLAIHVLNS